MSNDRPFSQRCRDRAADVWDASHDHPFVRALVNGSLDPERFKCYQMQDARYLEAIADAFVQIGTRCPNPEDKLWFVEAAERALQTERSLHLHYGDRLGYGPEDLRTLTLTPTNRAYQNHMLERTQRGTRLAALAAVAPCPWLYRDLGARIWNELGGAVDDDHPYADWIRRYADPAPDESMDIDELTGRLDQWAQGVGPAARERALTTFATSARYEWMFWEQAWTQQEWPV
ncbi:thiaminase II [Salinibacter sp. 10B]|uniref:TenA family protein n=1 Tax=Salinibacter sp. 10B TaxID=1923971 RepID=UPI000CF575B5|nr:TenA family protein [Salinibacter sp. 10B]PQJ34524.1 thiaminase II [Salinibacter sp. 10B]